MTELNYLDITKASDGHIKVPSIGLTSPAITESIAKTALASFADGAGGFPFKSLVGYINPVQNLNGQSAPYPAGGGKNKAYLSATNEYGKQRCDYTLTNTGITVTASGTYARVGFTMPVANNTQYTISFAGTSTGDYNRVVLASSTTWTPDYENAYLSSTEETKTLTFTTTSTTLFIGFYLTTNGTTGTMTVKNLQLELGATATPYAPYSNICPITGWTGMNVYRTGKNLFDISTSITKRFIDTSGTVSTSDNWSASDYISVKAGQTYTLSGVTNTGWAATHSFYDENKKFISYVYAINSDTFTVPDGAYYVRLSLKSETPTAAQLELGSTATAFEPYIGTTYFTDWGINQWDEEWEVGTLNTDGTNFPSVTNIRSTNYIPVLGSTTYFIKSPYGSGIQIFEYTTDKTYIKRTFVANSTITLAQNAAFIRFRTPDGVTTYNHDISINYPSTETGYHAYADPHAGIVYGGTLNPVTGVLTVTHGIDVYNGTTSPVVSVATSSITGNYYAIVNLTSVSRATNSSNVGGAISNMLTEGVTPTAQGKFSIIGSRTQAGQASLVLPDQTITTKSAFDTYLQSNPITLVYPLTTPQTYQLTPTEVTSLLGKNNVWVDTNGDVECTYIADTKLYIDSKL